MKKEYKTFIEQLMLLTVKINTLQGSGTGFFYQIIKENNETQPILITNKHVINNNENEQVIIQFHMHLGKHNALENRKFQIKTRWFFHETMDICFCFLKPINDQIEKITKTNITVYVITRDFIINNINEYSPLDELVMVGYPRGLINEEYNLPIFRKGYIASDPSVDFNQTKVGIVDMPCFPGSSGSPIFVYSDNYRRNKDNNRVLLEEYKLLGVLFKGPLLPKKGNIYDEDLRKPCPLAALTPIEMNLGYYITGNVLLDLEKIATKDFPSYSLEVAEIK